MPTPPPLSSPGSSIAVGRSLRRDVFGGLVVVAAAVALRWRRMDHSLWMDEMTTLVDYVLQPWSKVLAARAGQYVPNNHVLHTVVAKVLYTAVTGGRAAVLAGHPPAEAVLRLPALAAGVLLPVALAWPLRRRWPLAAAAVAVLATVDPWLVDLSTQARGYTLMLLLGVVATNLLPAAAGRTARPRRLAGYAVAVAAAVYTVPLAVLLVPAHAVAVWATDRAALRRWVVAAAAAGALTAAAYLPMVGGLISYYRRPYQAAPYRQFLDRLPRYVLTGQRLPPQAIDLGLPSDQYHWPDPPGSAVYWALPVLVAVMGSALGWPRVPEARPLLATSGAATVLAVLLPLVVPGASEVRFACWAGLWFVVAAGVLLAVIATGMRTPTGRPWPGRSTAAAAGVLMVGLMVRWSVRLPPLQQVRQAMAMAGRLAPPAAPIVVAYVGDQETTVLYAAEAGDHPVLPAFDGDQLARAEAESRAVTGRLPWVVLLFEQLARDPGRGEPGTARLWQDLTSHYRVVVRLPGRVSPVTIYAPRSPAAAAAPAVTDAQG